MPLPNQPWVAQVLLNDVDFDWGQSEALYLTQAGARTGIKQLTIDRNVLRGNLQADTCRITAYDDGTWFVPGKVSPGGQHPAIGVRVRVLAQYPISAGTWYPWFFGFIEAIDPDPNEPNPPEVTLTIGSPLSVLASLAVTLPELTNPKVYDPTDPDNSALTQLLKAANLWDTPYISLDPVGSRVLEGTWGGDKTFGQALSELTIAAEAVVSIEPGYALTAFEPDFVLHWQVPSPMVAGTVAWSAPDGDLNPSPRITFNGEQP